MQGGKVIYDKCRLMGHLLGYVSSFVRSLRLRVFLSDNLENNKL